MKKFSLILVSLALVSGVSQAQTVSDALRSCGQVQNSLKRLVCYDDIVKNMNAYGGLEDLMAVPAPLPAQAGGVSVPSRPVANTPVQSSQRPASSADTFGLEHKKTEDEDRVEKLYANVVSVSKNRKGKMTVTLDNGQVWKQTHSEELRMRANDRVYVERGLLGAFFMGKDSAKKRMKVTRVK